MLVCIWNAPEIVGSLLGSRWSDAAPTFAWISVGGLLSGLYSSLPWLFISQAKTSTMRRYMSVAAIFNLASFAVGTIWGVAGVAACASIVFLTVTTPMVAYGATRTGPVKLTDIVQCCLPYGLTAALVSAVSYAGNLYWPYSGVAKLTCSIVLSYTMVIGAAAAILPRERQLIPFGIAKVRAKLRAVAR